MKHPKALAFQGLGFAIATSQTHSNAAGPSPGSRASLYSGLCCPTCRPRFLSQWLKMRGPLIVCQQLQACILHSLVIVLYTNVKQNWIDYTWLYHVPCLCDWPECMFSAQAGPRQVRNRDNRATSWGNTWIIKLTTLTARGVPFQGALDRFGMLFQLA